ncbi:site-specific tyrosine recombinase XerC [Variovorax sp. PBL-H6]|uniref:tyrosine-type recombinase/integrase n=1 Tax=Variovorax sp. PBL-H6 TaxID=434009 RepID=UPI0013188052|nr:tyrosine-type recombinase/integrase [Variovorax sp. PBL-H6]VTU21406.1 site-specific tyrosine recombinase XerC [Variovorax sp. PBL-H6]
MNASAISGLRAPWNKDKLVGQKRPFKLKEIWAVRTRLQLSCRTRDLALFNLGIDSKLRACDLVKLRVRDVGTRQYARIVDSWVEEIGLDSADYGTHSMRRTKASLVHRRTRNLRAVQLLLGHTKLESTVRYLGIEVEDAVEIAEQTEA